MLFDASTTGFGRQSLATSAKPVNNLTGILIA